MGIDFFILDVLLKVSWFSVWASPPLTPFTWQWLGPRRERQKLQKFPGDEAWNLIKHILSYTLLAKSKSPITWDGEEIPRLPTPSNCKEGGCQWEERRSGGLFEIRLPQIP